MPRRLLLLISLACVLLASSARAAPLPVAYLPLVADGRSAEPAAPAKPITLELPFVVLNSVQPEPITYGGWTYFNVFRVDAGVLNGGWVLRYRPDAGVQAVRQVSEASEAQVRALEPVGRVEGGRGSLFEMRGALTWWGYGSEGRTDRLYIVPLEVEP